MKKHLSILASLSLICLLFSLVSSCKQTPSITITDCEVSELKAISAKVSGHYELLNIPPYGNTLWLEISENEDFSDSVSNHLSLQETSFDKKIGFLHPNTKYYWRLMISFREKDDSPSVHAYSEINSFETTSLDVNDYAADLGLPSGTLWGIMNVGAYSPNSSGIFVQYGDYKPRNDTSFGGIYGDLDYYKWAEKEDFGKYKFTKYYDDNKSELDLEDDAAYMNWGPGWRTPSAEQWEELAQYCSLEFSRLDGVNGVELTSLKNGNSIFLPVTNSEERTFNAGPNAGCYWSRTNFLSSSYKESITNATSLTFFFEVPNQSEYSNIKRRGKVRFDTKFIANGQTVRPVYNP